MHTKVAAYYISDKAFNNLVSIAQQQKYVTEPSQRAIGLSDFFNALAQEEFVDTRPPLVVQRHIEESLHGMAPSWTLLPRRSRLLKLTEDAVARYVMVAFEVGILRKEPFVIGGVSRLTPYPAISALFEGIGLGWVTPTRLPVGTKP